MGMARERIHPDTNARHKAYRERRIVASGNFARLEAAITNALDAGRNHHLADNLPEEPNARCEELCRRLSIIALVVFPRRAGGRS